MFKQGQEFGYSQLKSYCRSGSDLCETDQAIRQKPNQQPQQPQPHARSLQVDQFNKTHF